MIFASRITIKEFFTVILFKSFISGLLSASLFSPFFLMTIVSSIVSGAVIMQFEKLRKVKGTAISHIGVSVISAFISNFCQIIMSYLIFFGDLSLLLSPVIFIAGFISSVVVGYIANKCEMSFLNLYKTVDDIALSVKQSLDYKIKKKTAARFMLSFLFFSLCLFVSSFFRPQGNVLYTFGPVKLCDISLYNVAVQISLFAVLFALSLVISVVLVKKNGIKTSSVWIYYFYFTINNPIANKNRTGI